MLKELFKKVSEVFGKGKVKWYLPANKKDYMKADKDAISNAVKITNFEDKTYIYCFIYQEYYYLEYTEELELFLKKSGVPVYMSPGIVSTLIEKERVKKVSLPEAKYSKQWEDYTNYANKPSLEDELKKDINDLEKRMDGLKR